MTTKKADKKARPKTFEDGVKAGQERAWRAVFQVISDMSYKDDRELIKLLEAARDKAGFGPR